MTSILRTGEQAITAKYDKADAARQAQTDKAKADSTAEKDAAIAAAGSAWEEVNNNSGNHDTLTGAIGEGVSDLGTALAATGTAAWEALEDAATQVGADVADFAGDVASGVSEAVEKVGNVGKNLINGFKGIFKGLGNLFSQGVQDGQ